MADTQCSPDDQWCTFVHDVTHNQTLSQAADWLIAKPLSILLLLVIGYVVRWLVCRLIDRLARQAAAGVVPGVLATARCARFSSKPPARWRSSDANSAQTPWPRCSRASPPP